MVAFFAQVEFLQVFIVDCMSVPAMLYVTSDEMIPETHAHGFQKQATYALLLGFITFVLMEKCV